MSTFYPQYVGIDFSGSQAQWNPNVQASNVWIAVVEEQGAHLTLTSLQRVQQLPGQARPFLRLAVWIANGGFSAAAIDAPVSVPWWFFGQAFRDHAGLLAAIDGLPLHVAQDFPTGNAFIAHVGAAIPFPFTKPLRVTECYWRGRGVNTRSTVWGGARPDAPFVVNLISPPRPKQVGERQVHQQIPQGGRIEHAGVVKSGKRCHRP